MQTATYHFEIGNYKCLALQDGSIMGSADFLFANVPEGERARALETHHLEADQFASSWTCLLVDTGAGTLLVDTGIGTESPVGGHLFSQLKDAGYPADQIDRVFLTHGHPDHIGGCTDADGRPIFRQAKYLMGRVEHEFWTSEEQLAHLPDMMAGFARKNLPAIRGQLELVDGDDEVLPGIRVLEAYGHTPGHMALEIESQDQVLLHLADSALHPLHLVYPDWVATVDFDPDQTVATRKRLLAEAAQGDKQALFFHFDFPSIGCVARDGDAWRWEPLI